MTFVDRSASDPFAAKGPAKHAGKSTGTTSPTILGVATPPETLGGFVTEEPEETEKPDDEETA